jgi:signal transduction histidine kinase
MNMPLASSELDVNSLLQNYQRIIEISRQLNSTLEHRALLQQIISAVIEILKTEAASIMLIDPSTGELRFEISSNMDPNEMDTLVIPMEGSIAGWIATHGEPRVIENVDNEPDHFAAVDEAISFKTRNLLGVPLRTHKKVIGVVQAINKRNQQSFTEADVNTLTILASQAGIAIENARLFRQSDFIAEMVHELRTPLAGLKASTTLLNREDLPDDKRKDIIDLIQSETDRLIRLTTEFLDLARLESGRTRLEMTHFEFNKLVQESIDVVHSQAQEKGIRPQINGSSIIISGDRGKLKQVLLNLLTNAIKYNRPQGQITIDWETDEENRLVVSVKDTGQGISRENQKQMFQKFFRVADSSGFTQGTGLGLVITKHILEAHGGQIWLESEQGQGSTFFFALPLADK